MLKPTFSVTLGALRTTTDGAAAGPHSIHALRDMDIAADALQMALAEHVDARLGDAIEVQLGHDGANETVFAGTVVSLRPALAGMQITALGSMRALLDLRTTAWYGNQTAGSIARDLIGRASLAAGSVDDGPTLPRFAIDSHQSAFSHLKRLADRLGFELYAKRDGTVQFHGLGAGAELDLGGLLGAAQSAAGAAGGGQGFRYGAHLLAARAARVAPTWGRVVVGGESPMSGQGDKTAHWLTANLDDYRGEAGYGEPHLVLFEPAARTRDIAERFAAGTLATAGRCAHQVQIRVLGQPQVDLGDTVEVGDAPATLLNGAGYVRAVTHHFSAQTGFITDIRLALRAA